MKLERVLKFSRRILNEGIDIHALQKLCDYPAFQQACQVFKARIQGDEDAKKLFGLKDLDIYKGDPYGFINAVERATEYIEKRRKAKASRKGRKMEGIDFLYEDDNCFIVAPKSAEYSNKAAYLDGGTANWCIAAKEPERAQQYWDSYEAELVLYVYYKGEPNDSWAMVFKRKNLEEIQNGELSQLPIYEIEPRSNNARNNPMFTFDVMLQKTALTKKEFFGIIRSYMVENDFGGYTYNYRMATRCLKYDDVEGFKKHFSKIKEKKQLNELTVYCFAEGREKFASCIINSGKIDVNSKNPYYNERWLNYLIGRQASPTLVKEFIDAGADVNGLSFTRTPLQNNLCSSSRVDNFEKNFEITKVLVENGADLSYDGGEIPEESINCDALCFAVVYQKEEVVEYLLENGATLDCLYEKSYEILKLLIRGKKYEKVKWILSNLKEIKRLDDIFCFACCYGHPDDVDGLIEVLKMLLGHGANINGTLTNKTHGNLSYLEYMILNIKVPQCAKREDVSYLCRRMIEFLVENGADINHVRLSHTPLYLLDALEYFYEKDDYKALMKVFKKHGAKNY